MKKLLATLNNRADLSIIAELIECRSSVLDLGCGDGSLLHYLIREKEVVGMGMEKALDRVIACVQKGIPVIEQDLNQPFTNIKDGAYDYVILSQTIQELTCPDQLIDEILRVGKYALVSFPNFGFYKIRASLLFKGRMPKSKSLPYEWYNTPNIHLLTLADFTDFCEKRGYKIQKRVYFKSNKAIKRSLLLPNLFAEGCVALVTR